MNQNEKWPYAMDRLGTTELLTALASVRAGRVFDLATEIGHGMPHPDPSVMHGFDFNHHTTARSLLSGAGTGHDGNVEVITSSVHIGTHMDGLAHIACNGVVHGGHDIRSVYSDFGWLENGMEHSRPIIGRGVLLDIPSVKGLAFLPDQYEISTEDIEETLEAQKLTIRDGDTVLVRTGWMAEKYAQDPEGYFASQPGLSPEAGMYLYERGMAVLGTDTSGTEVIPMPDTSQTVHRLLLVERGVHLIEIMVLDELAAARVKEFLFVSLPLKLTGATGSWLRPIAII